MDEENKPFAYTYSAKEQAEIKAIRDRYLPPQDTKEDKMEQLRRLDAGVTQKATILAVIVGMAGSLILGTGMSLVMTDFSRILGDFQKYAMVLGIAIGIIGMVGIALALPVYNHVLRKERQRIAPKIIRLTDELMQ